MSKENGREKTCFVIAPIGPEGSEIRTRSDQVLKHVIAPSVESCGYKPLRADLISEPGIITSQVIQHVVEDPLVVADLTGWNPNVFYELALRHTLKKPVVQIIGANEKIPFDIAASRTIFFDHRDLDSVARAKEEIIKQVKAVEANPMDVDTPISVAVELQSLRKSDNPLEKSYGEIISMLTEIRTAIPNINESTRLRRVSPIHLDELIFAMDHLDRATARAEGTKGSESIAEIRSMLQHLGRAIENIVIEGDYPKELLLNMRRKLRQHDRNEI